MLGVGTLYIYDYAVLFTGTGALTVGPQGQSASVTLTGGSMLYANASADYGYATLPSLAAFGGEVPAGYGAGSGLLPALTGGGSGGFYIPPVPTIGYGLFPGLYGFGTVITSSPGEGNATFPVLVSKGGEGFYGEGVGTLPVLQSFGMDDFYPGEAPVNMNAYLFEGSGVQQDQIIVFDNTGQFVDTITGTRECIASLLGQMTATGNYTVLGEFIAGLYATAVSNLATTVSTSASGSTPETAVWRPAIDSTSRVWVVNLDTGASSQYDNYGFNSFFERDGEYFGVADDGIYRLDGDTDNGAPISSLLDFGVTDCGVPGRKKILNVHVGTTAGDDTYLRVTTESGTYTYQVEPCRRGPTGWRAKLPQGLQGTEWRFELVSNNDFELDGVEFTPARLSRRV